MRLIICVTGTVALLGYLSFAGQLTYAQQAASAQVNVQAETSRKALPNFAGRWRLNVEQSEGLDEGISKMEVFLLVTQSAQELRVEQRLRIRERDQPGQLMCYPLDGKTAEVPITRPLAGTAQAQARWQASEQLLELQWRITGKDNDQEVTFKTEEDWRLLDAGKALKVIRTRTTPEGSKTARLLFERQ